MAQAQARNGQHLPIVQLGAIIKDAAGLTFQVPNVIYPQV
jgi:hypothetical protein